MNREEMEDKVYEMICKNRGCSYDMVLKKIRDIDGNHMGLCIKSLIKQGLVTEIVESATKRLYPTTFTDLFPENLRDGKNFISSLK